MNSGINNNTYIGNFRVQQQSDSATMMNQMTDGFKPFYKKYDQSMINQSDLTASILSRNSNQQLGNNNYVSPVWEFLAQLSRNYV